jgi:hypothetical protein
MINFKRKQELKRTKIFLEKYNDLFIIIIIIINDIINKFI